MRTVLLALLAGLLPLGAAAQALTVSAAASLTEAFREIGTRFEAARPGTQVRFNFGASGALAQQIVQGAPADVFASADQEAMDRVAQRQVIDAVTRRDFARNTLVLAVPARDAPPIAGLADLGSPAVRRIALGKPASVPAGRYARQALEAAGLWGTLAPKLVFADSVRQALDYVARGEVEAGFVYATDAALLPGKLQVALTVAGHPPITYPAAAVRDSRQPALARAFVDFLATPEAQAVLARRGFSPP